MSTNHLDLDYILGLRPFAPDLAESELLGPSPFTATPEEVQNANLLLADQLRSAQNVNPTAAPQVSPLPHADYKKFDPLNQKLSTNFNQPDFTNPQELVEKIDIYFQELEDPNFKLQRVQPSVASLALHLNVSRKKLNDLEEKPIYGPIISAAKTRLEAYLSGRLVDGRTSTGGIALVLKNDFDWREKQELSGEMTFSVTRQMFSTPPQLDDHSEEVHTIDLNPDDNA